MKKSNITCTYLATGFPENRSTFFRKAVPKDNISVESPEGEDEVDMEESNNNEVTLTARESKYQEINMLQQSTKSTN